MTRREFVAMLAAAGAAVAAMRAAQGAIALGGRAPGEHAERRPVVSFHMDRPYIDPTGTAEPYLPPHGARSGEHAARLDEATFRRICCYA